MTSSNTTADGAQVAYPPPVMLPPPSSGSVDRSSSSSLGRKRKKPDLAEGDSYAASSVSSEFSATTKRKVEHFNAMKTCFHCGATPVDVCHVIGRKDRMFPELCKQGLISFDHLGHFDNAIPYCPLCHRNFDDMNNPGLILWPIEIRYLADYERENFTQREATARATGYIPPRECPNAKMYLEHQIKTKQVPEGACGGLYVRCTLRNYFPQLGQDTRWIPGVGPFQEPESWHGDPMATIRRCFLILGSPVPLLPAAVKKELEELRDLYHRQIILDEPVTANATPNNADRGDRDRSEEERAQGRRGSGSSGYLQPQPFGTPGTARDASGGRNVRIGRVPAENDGPEVPKSNGGPDFQADSATWLAFDDSTSPGEDFVGGTMQTCKRGCETGEELHDLRGASQSWGEKRRRQATSDERIRVLRLPRQRRRAGSDVWQWGPQSTTGAIIEALEHHKRNIKIIQKGLYQHPRPEFQQNSSFLVRF